MANYKMVFSYDGARYKGWQKLGNQEATIQGTIETCIEKVLKHSVEIHGSGRTDAGVHAVGQVANMKLPFLLKDDFQLCLNQELPEDIRLQTVERVEGTFHARYSAKGKIYSYYIDLKEKPGVFTRKYSYHYPEKLDMDLMRAGITYVLGEHDFSAFTDDKTDKDKVRQIYAIRISEEKGILKLQYVGDGFLQHMIRILTGTLLEVGKGMCRPEDMKKILELKERANAGPMVPAKGLFLENVEYD